MAFVDCEHTSLAGLHLDNLLLVSFESFDRCHTCTDKLEGFESNSETVENTLVKDC